MNNDFKSMIQNIIDGLGENNPNGIELYHGSLKVIEEPVESFEKEIM